ncbi:MAG: DUF421 domain-containing protein [Candidatus Merdivicinus sp.]|jgi:uncharacterized membrane protein YcaP (DUF421 family)
MIVLIRSVLLYLLIIFCLRLMGKRQLGELQPSELVITILISNIASLPIEDNSIPMAMGVVPIIVLAAFELITSTISLRSKRFRTLVSGRPMIIIRDGKIDQQAMRQLRFSIDDLMESLRGKSIFDPKDVQFAIVETTGQVSVYPKFAAQSATAGMLKLKGNDANPPTIVISDGQILSSALEACGLNEQWIFSVLRGQALNPTDVFLMTADSSRQYTIVPKEGIRKGGSK